MLPARRRLLTGLKSALALIIAAGVAVYFLKLLSDPHLSWNRFTIRWSWLALAAVLYLSAHTIWATYWWLLLKNAGAAIPWPIAIRAYFISQLGKYVPGKIWVLVLRVGLLGRTARRSVVITTGIYETLTSMSAGSAISAILFTYLLGGQGVIPGGTALLILGACVPLIAWGLSKVAFRILARRRESDVSAIPTPSFGFLIGGLLQASAGWCLLGLSAGLTIRGLVPEPPNWSFDSFLSELAAVTVSYVAGFVVLVAPGGVGARELVLQQALTPVLAPASGSAAAALSAAIALALRLIWTVAELVLIGLLSLNRISGKEQQDGR